MQASLQQWRQENRCCRRSDSFEKSCLWSVAWLFLMCPSLPLFLLLIVVCLNCVGCVGGLGHNELTLWELESGVVVALGWNKVIALYLPCSYVSSKAALWWQTFCLSLNVFLFPQLMLWVSAIWGVCLIYWGFKSSAKVSRKAENLPYFYWRIRGCKRMRGEASQGWRLRSKLIYHTSLLIELTRCCHTTGAISALRWQVTGTRGGLWNGSWGMSQFLSSSLFSPSLLFYCSSSCLYL